MKKTLLFAIITIILLNYNSYSQEKSEQKGVWIGRQANERIMEREFADIPEKVRNCHAQGTFIVRVLVDKEGNVEKTSLIAGLGKKADEFVLGTVANWKFKPLKKDKETVYFRGLVTISFWYGSFENPPY